MAALDFPYELGAFVAQRHGLALSEAEGLIARWVSQYKSTRQTTPPAAFRHGLECSPDSDSYGAHGGA